LEWKGKCFNDTIIHTGSLPE